MLGAIRLLKNLNSSASIGGKLMADREDYFIVGQVDGSD